ncbi:hypothetical protein GCM10011491_31010 [Brucella endophytica]|uniref:Uncharacterized protein n=1 Tax=Brucella endophytica TaxID=1963359 RepID=A0A916SKC7_9HYPH|nr:hypothetical protein [Brucella endophytica]GGB00625.1 hypothetical protein GCM10011491_31010 [Brucella endophytica]
MSENEQTGQIDPDPAIIVSLVIAAVAAIGTIGQAAAAFQANKIARQAARRSLLEDSLIDHIRDTIRRTERFLKLIGRNEIGAIPASSQIYRFGNSPLLLDRQQFEEFSQLSDALFADARFIQSSVLGILQHTPERAHQIGVEILSEQRNTAEKLNSLNKGDHSLGEALNEVLGMLRAYERILDRLNRSN